MSIKIADAGNIKKTEFEVISNKLNIKLGVNGLGKSTIAKSVYFKIVDQEKLSSLKTYGLDKSPEVEVPEEFRTCMYFDKAYVDNFLFKDELLNNSYEIVIKTENFEQSKKDIEGKISKLIQIAGNEILKEFSTIVSEFNNNIGFNISGEIDSKKPIGKGLKNGNFENLISDVTRSYEKQLKANFNFSWSKWFSDGKNYVIGKECPYCLKILEDNFETIRGEIETTFTTNSLKENMFSREMFSKVSKFSSIDQKDIISRIISSEKKPTLEESILVKGMIAILNKENTKIEELSKLSPIILLQNLQSDLLIKLMNSLKLDEELFLSFSKDYFSISRSVNDTIDEIIQMIDLLMNDLGILNGILSSNIKKTKKFINDFLKISGIPYVIDVKTISDTKSFSVLMPKDVDLELKKPKESLSYGELNAISLVLFSVEAIQKNIDLIILDDPVSSYDNNKKFAIFHHLFKKSKTPNFHNKTVIMFTHDLTPIIDFVYTGIPCGDYAKASFLEIVNGIIKETEITKDQIKCSLKYELGEAKDKAKNIISRIIHYRKYLELNDDVEDGKYDVVSSFLHTSCTPQWKNEDSILVDFSEDELAIINPKIQSVITEFDYIEMIKLITDNNFLKEIYESSSPSEKLNIVRVYIDNNDINEENEVLWKFINESYHIENDLIYTLNPHRFNQLPEFVTKLCDEIIL